MLILTLSGIVLVLGLVALATFTESWPQIFGWLGSIGIVGIFSLVLGLAAVFALAGFLVIRRATPR